MIKGKFQGYTPTHGGADQHRPVKFAPGDPFCQDLIRFLIAGRRLSETRHVNGQRMVAGSGQFIQGPEFLPGCSLKFHPVQQDDILPRRLTRLEIVQTAGGDINSF